MATVTAIINSNTKFVFNYTVTTTNTQTAVKVNSVSFTSTRTGGLAQKYTVHLYENSFTGAENVVTLAAGTTSKSITLSGTRAMDRDISDSAIPLGFVVSMVGANGTSYSASASTSVKVPALTKYTNTYYPNGGSGSNQTQDHYYGRAFTAKASSTFSRTNYVFKSWNTAANGTGTTYTANKSYTVNSSLALYAQWYAPYTITPDANGGTLASGCGNLVKVYNTAKALWAASLNPSRTNYTFKSWNTAANGSGTSYAAGASYTANANATLYAQWEQVYASPQLAISKAYRCDSNGNASDEGTCARVVGTIKLFKTSTTNTVGSLSASVNGASVSLTSAQLTTLNNALADSGTWRNGSFDVTIVTDSTTQLDQNQSYSVTVTVNDTQGGASGRSTNSTPKSATIGTAFYTIDVLEGGHGICFGGVAKEEAFEVDMPARFKSNDQTVPTVKVIPKNGISYIDGCAGNGSAVYVPKHATGVDAWEPALALQTKGGGGWAIGNHNNEQLQFIYGSPENIASGTNTTLRALVLNSDGTIGVNNHSSAIGSLQSNTATNLTRTASIDTRALGASVTLTPGSYVIVGRWIFNTGTSGVTSRNLEVSLGTDASSIWASQRVNSYGYGFTALQCIHLSVVTASSTTVYCMGSGSQATNASYKDTSYIYALRIV